MVTKEDIEKGIKKHGLDFKDKIQIELLLDVRDLLKEINREQKTLDDEDDSPQKLSDASKVSSPSSSGVIGKGDTSSTLNEPKGCRVKYYKGGQLKFICGDDDFLCPKCKKDAKNEVNSQEIIEGESSPTGRSPGVEDTNSTPEFDRGYKKGQSVLTEHFFKDIKEPVIIERDEWKRLTNLQDTKSTPKCKFCNDTKWIETNHLDGTTSKGTCPQCYIQDTKSALNLIEEWWADEKTCSGKPHCCIEECDLCVHCFDRLKANFPEDTFYECGHDRNTVILDCNELSIAAWLEWNESVGSEGDKSKCWNCWCNSQDKSIPLEQDKKEESIPKQQDINQDIKSEPKGCGKEFEFKLEDNSGRIKLNCGEWKRISDSPLWDKMEYCKECLQDRFYEPKPVMKTFTKKDFWQLRGKYRFANLEDGRKVNDAKDDDVLVLETQFRDGFHMIDNFYILNENSTETFKELMFGKKSEVESKNGK